MVDPGRRATDGAELAMEREIVRGTERARVRRKSIFVVCKDNDRAGIGGRRREIEV